MSKEIRYGSDSLDLFPHGDRWEPLPSCDFHFTNNDQYRESISAGNHRSHSGNILSPWSNCQRIHSQGSLIGVGSSLASDCRIGIDPCFSLASELPT
ncbi:MAG TPA: hypothetical protein DIV79_05130, partial [Opitutae bacterium]|nr:hypothetical protein [Opitutae bacterium]